MNGLYLSDHESTGVGGTASSKPYDRQRVPEPVFQSEPGLVELYWKAWDQAWDHVKHQEGVPQSPYMDEAFQDDTIWIWDTCFMTLFCRYAPDQFPGIESLKNFYIPAHDGLDKMALIVHHPDNPPLFAWAEYDYFMLTGDVAHIKTLLRDKQYLQKHYKWFAGLKRGQTFTWSRVPVGIQSNPLGFHWGGVESGMDNSPRFFEDVIAIDAIAQQGLAAQCIAFLANRAGLKEIADEWQAEYARIKDMINEHYWDEEDGFYYDLSPDGKSFSKVRTPASFWPVIAGMATKDQVARMAKRVRDPQDLGGVCPMVSLSRTHPNFNDETGNYWQGSLWLPTAYMAVRALSENGQEQLADETAEGIVRHMLRTYEEFSPHTIWECYGPTKPEPAKHDANRVRPDFCGWSALGPISLFIENVLGFHSIDADQNVVNWRLHQSGENGIRRLRFGNIVTDIVYDGKGSVDVTSSGRYMLNINGNSFDIQPGQQRIAAAPKGA